MLSLAKGAPTMPSPFPGMDPFIEGQEWEDFHHELISAIREALMSQVLPRYVVRVEKRVYLEHQAEERPVFLTLPMLEEQEEAFLTIRLRETMEIVAVIELLSPTN